MRCRKCGYTLSEQRVQNKCPYCAAARKELSKAVVNSAQKGKVLVLNGLPRIYNNKGKLK